MPRGEAAHAELAVEVIGGHGRGGGHDGQRSWLAGDGHGQLAQVAAAVLTILLALVLAAWEWL